MSAIGLFPSLRKIGGIERAGGAAWQAVSDCDPAGGRLIEYDGVHKFAAVRAAMSERWPAEFVLVWHVGLLKLLPLLRPRPERVVLFLHGIEAWRRVGPVTRQIMRGVDLFLANSEYTWRRFVASNPEFEFFIHRVVPLGLGAATPRPPAPSTTPTAIMIGRIVRSENYKGHVETIAAWKHVNTVFPDAELHIVGPCDMESILLAEARRHGVEDSVHVHGAVDEDRKHELLVRSRCLALPSRGEGFGLVYLEAMRLGRPCLVGDSDAGREVVNPPEAGLAVDPGHPEAVASALCRLMSEGRDWDVWSANARTRYAAQYTEAHFQRRLMAAIGDSL